VDEACRSFFRKDRTYGVQTIVIPFVKLNELDVQYAAPSRYMPW
jgi:hypothetical protein